MSRPLMRINLQKMVMKTNRYIIILLLLQGFIACEKSSDSFSSSTGTVKNGSMSRIIAVGTYLYAVDDERLQTINASNPAAMRLTDEKSLGASIQTVYHHKGMLYIGSASRMYVYDISSNAANPTQVSVFDYPPVFLARDPILAFDSVIYATTTSGGGWGSFRVFDNRNIRNPLLRTSIDFPEPRGMDRVDSTLYLCDGRFGLKIMDIKQPWNPSVVRTIDQDRTLNGQQNGTDIYFDVIAVSPLLFCYVQDGLQHYDISKPRQPRYLKKIQ
jgi:hypothetical protein